MCVTKDDVKRVWVENGDVFFELRNGSIGKEHIGDYKSLEGLKECDLTELVVIEMGAKLSFGNKAAVLKSKQCGCYYCTRIFNASEIVEYGNDDLTALCPYCGIDSVIPDDSVKGMTVELLQKMRKKWFETTVSL